MRRIARLYGGYEDNMSDRCEAGARRAGVPPAKPIPQPAPDPVEEAGEESFPASDAPQGPAHIGGPALRPPDRPA